LEIKHARLKDEMKKDPLLDALNTAKAMGLKYQKVIIGVVALAVVVTAGVIGYQRIMAARVKSAEDAFGKAIMGLSTGGASDSLSYDGLKSVITKHAWSPQAVYSAYLLGLHSLKTNNTDEAIRWFTKASAGNAKAGFVSGQATEGLALCYEKKGDREKALLYFGDALKDSRIAFRHPAIRWRMALLNKELGKDDATVRFCEEIIADTTAKAFKQGAENMIAELMARKRS
jgi:hypothetical protein